MDEHVMESQASSNVTDDATRAILPTHGPTDHGHIVCEDDAHRDNKVQVSTISNHQANLLEPTEENQCNIMDKDSRLAIEHTIPQSIQSHGPVSTAESVAEEMNQDESPSTQAFQPIYNFDQQSQPLQLASCENEFSTSFLKGAKWSPDGSCLLASSDDKRLRVLPLPQQFYTGDFSQPIPEMSSSCTVKEGGTIYDFCWHPLMSGYDPSSCRFLCTSTSSPIHMWDALSGSLAATYRPINHLDEIVAAHSLAVSPDGLFIYSGYNKSIRIFDVDRPGKQIEEIKTHKKRQTGQTGIISCFDFQPESQVFAAGSYNRSVGVYDTRSSKQTMVLEGHSGGVTHLRFANSSMLISGGRKDAEMLVWDMRSPGQILAVLNRQVETNQRIYFDLDPSHRYVVSGCHDGTTRIWDLQLINQEEPEHQLKSILSFQSHADTTNSCSFHPSLALLATGSGRRHPSSKLSGISDDSSGDSSDDDISNDIAENSVKLWWLGA